MYDTRDSEFVNIINVEKELQLWWVNCAHQAPIRRDYL